MFSPAIGYLRAFLFFMMLILAIIDYFIGFIHTWGNIFKINLSRALLNVPVRMYTGSGSAALPVIRVKDVLPVYLLGRLEEGILTGPGELVCLGCVG